MKCMNCMGCQTLLLVGLAVVGGGVANLARSGDPEKFLPWKTDLYAPPKPRPGPTAPSPTREIPVGRAPQVTPGPDTGDSGTSKPEVNTPVVTIPQTDPPEVSDVPTELPGTEEGEFLKVGFEVAMEEYEAGSAFVDARRTKEYIEGHITGAVSISPYEQSVLAEKIIRLSDEVPEEAPVVVYCTASEDCEDSALISRQLEAAGFQNVTIYKGGFPEWEAKLRNDERRSKLITKGAEPGERDL